jgi:hypothetical protein
MYDGQIEMSFGKANIRCPNRQRRLNRARWWFQRMREAVEHAIDRQPCPVARPEQIWLPGAHRQVELAPATEPSAEREVCA